MDIDRIAGADIRRLMRKHKRTIQGLAKQMQISQKRVRQVMRDGVSDGFVRDWLEALSSQQIKYHGSDDRDYIGRILRVRCGITVISYNVPGVGEVTAYLSAEHVQERLIKLFRGAKSWD